MDEYEFIRVGHRVYGKSISELARITGHSRNTVKKAIRGEPWGYKERKHQPFPVLGPYMEPESVMLLVEFHFYEINVVNSHTKNHYFMLQ